MSAAEPDHLLNAYRSVCEDKGLNATGDLETLKRSLKAVSIPTSAIKKKKKKTLKDSKEAQRLSFCETRDSPWKESAYQYVKEFYGDVTHWEKAKNDALQKPVYVFSKTGKKIEPMYPDMRCGKGLNKEMNETRLRWIKFPTK